MDGNPFVYSKPSHRQILGVDRFRQQYRSLYGLIVTTLPHSREREQAILRLQESFSWMSRAIQSTPDDELRGIDD